MTEYAGEKVQITLGQALIVRENHIGKLKESFFT